MLKFILYWATFHTLGRLPLPFLYTLMSSVASVAYRLAPGVRRNLDENLRHVMPEAGEPKRRAVAKRILRNVALYYADVAHLPRMDLKHFFEKRLVFHGLDEYLRPAIADGKGVIILSAHYGNPELGVQALAHLGIPVFALTEPVHPRMSKLMDEFRASKGVTFEPVSVGAVKRVFQTLKRGGVVALMGDRDIGGLRRRCSSSACPRSCRPDRLRSACGPGRKSSLVSAPERASMCSRPGSKSRSR